MITVLHTYDDPRFDLTFPAEFHERRLAWKDASRGQRPLYIELSEALFNVLAPIADQGEPLPYFMRRGSPMAIFIMMTDREFAKKLGREISVTVAL